MSGTKQRVFRAYLAAYQLLANLAETHEGRAVRLLDIGGAHGIHARFFRRVGIRADVVDVAEGDEPAIFVGDYLDFKPSRPYDVIWSSHVLEHVPNVGLFINKMRQDMAPDGYCAISVPPLNELKMAYNHLTLWNPGILLLNAGHHGFDLTTAQVARYGYNVSLIARKGVSAIKEGFPVKMKLTNKHFRGDVRFTNWAVKRLPDTEWFEIREVQGKGRWHYQDECGRIFPCR